MAHNDERLTIVGQQEIVNVHRCLFLFDRLLCVQIEEHQEAVSSPTSAEEPFPLGMEFEVIDKAVEFVAWELVSALGALPVEDLDARSAVEMINIADLADAADGQLRPVR